MTSVNNKNGYYCKMPDTVKNIFYLKGLLDFKWGQLEFYHEKLLKSLLLPLISDGQAGG